MRSTTTNGEEYYEYFVNISKTPISVFSNPSVTANVPLRILPLECIRSIDRIYNDEQVWLKLSIPISEKEKDHSFLKRNVTEKKYKYGWVLLSFLSKREIMKITGPSSKEIQNKLILYSNDLESIDLFHKPLMGSKIVGSVPSYASFEIIEYVYNADLRVWGKLSPRFHTWHKMDEAWICLSGGDDVNIPKPFRTIEIPLSSPTFYVRNIFRKNRGFLPIRQEPSLNSSLVAYLPIFTVVKAKGWSLTGDGQLWIEKAAFPSTFQSGDNDSSINRKENNNDFANSEGWMIQRNAADGSDVLEVLEADEEPFLNDKNPIYYRTIYQQGATPLRTAPSIEESSVVGKLPLGMVVRATERRMVKDGKFWCRLRTHLEEQLAADGIQTWAIERNSRDGNFILCPIQPPGKGMFVYKNLHNGNLTIMSEPTFKSSDRIGEISAGKCFCSGERRMNEKCEMWVSVTNENEDEKGWVPESIGGVESSIYQIQDVHLFADIKDTNNDQNEIIEKKTTVDTAANRSSPVVSETKIQSPQRSTDLSPNVVSIDPSSRSPLRSTTDSDDFFRTTAESVHEFTSLDLADASTQKEFTNTVSKPILHPSAGFYQGPTSIKLSSSTENTRFHYTLNGSNPTLFSRYCDKDPPTINFEKSGNYVLKVMAVVPGLAPSEITEAQYNITVPKWYVVMDSIRQCIFGCWRIVLGKNKNHRQQSSTPAKKTNNDDHITLSKISKVVNNPGPVMKGYAKLTQEDSEVDISG